MLRNAKSVAAIIAIMTSLVIVTVGVSGITAASAKVDVSKISATNEPFGFFFEACGGDWIEGTFSFHQISVSNGHFTGQAILKGQIIDLDTNQVVGRAINPGVFIVNSDGLPTTQRLQQEVTCIGSGEESAIHFGFTIDEQGKLHVHP
jgi:hypothetical protein